MTFTTPFVRRSIGTAALVAALIGITVAGHPSAAEATGYGLEQNGASSGGRATVGRTPCFSTMQEMMDYLFPGDPGTHWNVIRTVKQTKRRTFYVVRPDADLGYDLFGIVVRRGCPTAIYVHDFGWNGEWLPFAGDE